MSHIYFIMPVGSDPKYELKREQLAQLSNDTGRDFFFPLERHNFFSIRETKTDLLNASLVIADLSLERPSCYFELGIAEALGVPVYVIAAVDTILHQTGSSIIPLYYSNLFQYREVVRQCIGQPDSNEGISSEIQDLMSTSCIRSSSSPNGHCRRVSCHCELSR